MRKPKYVLTGLTWLLHCFLNTIYAVNTSFAGSLITKSQAYVKTSGQAYLHTGTSQKVPEEKYAQISSVVEEHEHVATENHTSGQGMPSQKEGTSWRPSDTSSATLPHQDVSSPLLYNTTQDPEPKEPESPIEFIVQYNAEDSIVFNVKDQTIQLYGEGVIKYDTIKLEAEKLFLDWTNYTIAASSKKNKAGKIEKKTVLTKESVEYIAEDVNYNFKSQRATANKLFTKQGDGILQSNKIKKDSATTFYADQANYTTCNLTKPHFHVGARRIKITEGDKIVSGPFRLYFDGVPTPLGFPIGIFYFPHGSGVILPKYGGQSEKGLCLKNGGFYIKFNDYVNLVLLGSVCSKGDTEFLAKSIYKKRYQYNGDLFYKRTTDLPTQEVGSLFKKKKWELKWNHRTENNRTSSFNAEVHLKSKSPVKVQGILEENSISQNNTNSSIRYTHKLWELPYTLAVSLQHTLNSQNQKGDATIPNTTLRTANIYPFRKKGKTIGNWYSDIYFQHNVSFENRLSNKIENNTLDFFKTKDWTKLWKNGRWGVQHIIPIQANIKLLRYLSLTPKFEWRERYYGEKIDYTYDTRTNDIVKEKVPGFVRVYDYDFEATLKTTLYGTHLGGENATVQALRHVFEPVLRFTYVPDFSSPRYGYWQTIKGGKKEREKLNKFEGAIYSPPSNRASAVLKIDLNNRLDMIVNAREHVRKTPILESFDWSTNYDFCEKNNPWGDIQFKTRTSLFDKMFDFSFKATFNPYLYKGVALRKRGSKREYIKTSELAWNHGKGLGYMKDASLNIGAKLGPKAKDLLDQSYKPEDGQGIKQAKKEGAYNQYDPGKYVDFKIPWNLNLNYNWNYTRATPGDDPQKINSLSFEWHIYLTEKWQVTCKSVYDLTKSKWVGNATDIGIHRDLHCWEMDFNWNPLGDEQTYRFSIGLKAPLLKDLTYSRNNAYTKY